MTTKNYGRFEKDIAETFSSAIIESSPSIDTFSTWLLGGTAAAVALLLSNIDKLVPQLGAVPSKLVLLILGVSVIFGLLQKFTALQLHMGQKIAEAAETRLAKLVATHAGKEVADPYAYIRENANAVDAIILIVSSFPQTLRNKMINRYLRNSSDPAELNRSQVNLLIKQFAQLTAQAICVIIAIPIAAYGI